MKKKILVQKSDNRIYLRDIDIKELKPLLSLANIEIHTSQQGKYTGVPRHYIDLDKGFAFLLSLTNDYIITMR